MHAAAQRESGGGSGSGTASDGPSSMDSDLAFVAKGAVVSFAGTPRAAGAAYVWPGHACSINK